MEQIYVRYCSLIRYFSFVGPKAKENNENKSKDLKIRLRRNSVTNTWEIVSSQRNRVKKVSKKIRITFDSFKETNVVSCILSKNIMNGQNRS